MDIKKLFKYSKNQDFTLSPPSKENSGISAQTEKKISARLSENLEFIEKAFSSKENFDFVIRRFQIGGNGGTINGFLIFYDGLSDQTLINRDILRSLITAKLDAPISAITGDDIERRIIAQGPLKKAFDMQEIIDAVGFGECGIFVDGFGFAFLADVKGFGARDVGQPITEAVLSGPQEAFTETIMNNIGLIRKILKDPHLISRKLSIGSRSKTPCALMYINGITNKSLVREAMNRLKKIEIEYLFSSSEVEMLIEDSTFFPLPQIIKTERPDRAAAQLSNGKVVVLVQGSPFALVIPATAPDLIQSPEDSYVRFEEANFMRLVRIFGIFISLFLPGSFVAVMLYHHESIPTDLLFAIERTREAVPLGVVFELILMEFAFELIKEAAVRVPSPTGSALGIVGGLILGQAAAEANLVSPISIIIVSLSGLGSFASPSVALSRAVALMRFIFIILCGAAGFLGLAAGVVVLISLSARITSFGVPYFSPLAPRYKNGLSKAVFIAPLWKREHRPEALKTIRAKKQPPISRKWKKGV